MMAMVLPDLTGLAFAPVGERCPVCCQLLHPPTVIVSDPPRVEVYHRDCYHAILRRLLSAARIEEG